MLSIAIISIWHDSLVAQWAPEDRPVYPRHSLVLTHSLLPHIRNCCLLSLLLFDVDPNAIPNETYIPFVDSALRHISHSLLLGSELPTDDMKFQYKSLSQSLSSFVFSSSDAEWPKDEVTTCLVYVRDRVSVPRDMSVHAARLFRSHINLFLEVLNSKQ